MRDRIDDILAAFVRLVSEREAERAQPDSGAGNFRCASCTGCEQCRFCTDCSDCISCTHCDSCSECETCTQCRECFRCIECTHSNLCAMCERCSYAAMCFDCEGCVHCFACAGLQDEEFCILNERHSQRDYFARMGALKAELEAHIAAGWRPPWAKSVPPTGTPGLSPPAAGVSSPGPAEISNPTPEAPASAGVHTTSAEPQRFARQTPISPSAIDSPPRRANVGARLTHAMRPARPQPRKRHPEDD